MSKENTGAWDVRVVMSDGFEACYWVGSEDGARTAQGRYTRGEWYVERYSPDDSNALVSYPAHSVVRVEIEPTEEAEQDD